jgi:hypothetical protein
LELGMTSSMKWILLFLVPHFFTWILARSVSGTPGVIPRDGLLNPEAIFAIALVFLIVFFLDVSGVVFAILQISNCFTSDTACNTVSFIFNLVMIFIYLIIAFSTLIQTGCMFVIERSLEQHYVLIYPHFITLIERQPMINEADNDRTRSELLFTTESHQEQFMDIKNKKEQ